ncbi:MULTISPECIES: response regulator transcription factor [unclassified Clostridioides]|uniref:response regulator transcription factor n=1 Tax=unclassified Clostridioides TaxID=2635829 RepID=UPI001D103F16|nr:response regulator [Clostridioides sp. ES-S-0145-01]MCC0681930.1 response regulator [Clostridioides sp. ES-S-0005-03]MCC0709320.1 response regulator [Clostridioides sp. ES-S-0190-01]UDN64122.1 response regulator [Clostridioides sp. ES-W-0016-02]
MDNLYKILIINSTFFISNIIKTAINNKPQKNKCSFSVINKECVAGNELEEIEKNKIKIVIIDINTLNEIRLIKEISENFKEINIIVLTSLSDQLIRDEILKYTSYYIKKPLAEIELWNKLDLIVKSNLKRKETKETKETKNIPPKSTSFCKETKETSNLTVSKNYLLDSIKFNIHDLVNELKTQQTYDTDGNKLIEEAGSISNKENQPVEKEKEQANTSSINLSFLNNFEGSTQKMELNNACKYYNRKNTNKCIEITPPKEDKRKNIEIKHTLKRDNCEKKEKKKNTFRELLKNLKKKS